MKPPRLYVVCPICFRPDLPRAVTKKGKPTGLMHRAPPRAPAFTRQSAGLGRALGFEHTHESVELADVPKDVLKLMEKRARAFLEALEEL